ncbi:hypothetical protein DFH29DRAFT_953146 [Suillus ampliporus]|nr:hypothetical protein DFH29DRAFT_953146 [Suillus ampliporus]
MIRLHHLLLTGFLVAIDGAGGVCVSDSVLDRGEWWSRRWECTDGFFYPSQTWHRIVCPSRWDSWVVLRYSRNLQVSIQ